MGLSWKIGRVAGIDLYVHPTFLLVLLWAWWSNRVASIPLLLSVFGCVLLHELGHALMARRFGIGTEDITLYPIGGVARLQRIPRAPGAELMITLAGPAVNFALAFLFAILSSLDSAAGSTSSLGYFVQELLLINLVLGVFNLVPAFPMDGGRILRALLSGWLGRAQATVIAVRIGRTLAILFGIYSLLDRNPVQIALAAFIYFAAGVEEAQVLLEERRRAFNAGGAYKDQDQGIWVAPPGHHWVDQGDGIWRLVPVVVRAPSSRWDAPSWR
jgi:Zn-dependent protease